jgi:hypothetical protein
MKLKKYEAITWITESGWIDDKKFISIRKDRLKIDRKGKQFIKISTYEYVQYKDGTKKLISYFSLPYA